MPRGNPHPKPGPGRPKGRKNNHTLEVERVLKKAATDTQAAKELWKLVKKGNQAAINQFYNRRWGAVPTYQQLGGELGFQLRIIHDNGDGEAAPGSKPVLDRRRKKPRRPGRTRKKVG